MSGRARITLAALLVATGVLSAFGSASATTGPDPHVALKVTITDSKITLAKHAVHDVTYVDFLVHNAGKVTHNFKIADLSTPALRPGQTAHLLAAFPGYGKYRYKVTVHGTKAMAGWFTVDRPLPPG